MQEGGDTCVSLVNCCMQGELKMMLIVVCMWGCNIKYLSHMFVCVSISISVSKERSRDR